MESDYVDHKNGQTAVLWTWGCASYKNAQLYDNQAFGYMSASCRDGSGEAGYAWSFEPELQVHGEFSYGVEVGQVQSADWDSGSDAQRFVTYPATAGASRIFVFVDPDFTTGTNPSDIPTT